MSVISVVKTSKGLPTGDSENLFRRPVGVLDMQVDHPTTYGGERCGLEVVLDCHAGEARPRPHVKSHDLNTLVRRTTALVVPFRELDHRLYKASLGLWTFQFRDRASEPLPKQQPFAGAERGEIGHGRSESNG